MAVSRFLTQRTLSAIFAMAVTASAGAQSTAQVYQQRTADGRIVFSDRPDAAAITQRTWQFTPEDPQAAQQRRDEASREAQAVTERIQRRLDEQQQRDEQREIERLRLAEAQARLDAERARAEAARQPTIVHVPVVAHRPPRPHAVQVPPPRQPKPPRPPRPGPPKPSTGPGERR